jgi:thioredoxin-dependent peroxiredoxin
MRALPFVPTFLCVLWIGACGQTVRPDGGEGLLPVGSVAPELTGSDAKGDRMLLSSTRGRLAVVYFYPKDETPGCTKQACAFRDQFERFASSGISIFGVSRDSEQSHAQFRKEHELPFALVADQSGDAQRAYGVPSAMPGIAARVTFLIDKDGKIARVWPEVDPVQNVSEVLAAAKQLEAGAP